MTPAAGKGVPRRSGRVLLPALSLVIVLGTWEAAVHVFGLSPLLLPPPSAIGPALWDGLVAGRWWDDIWVTTIETVLGFAIGAVIGLILGGLISEVELFRHVVYPYVVAIQSVPKLAIAPLLVIWLGSGLSSKVALVALVVLFPVAVNTAEASNPPAPAGWRCCGCSGRPGGKYSGWPVYRPHCPLSSRASM